MHVTTINHTCPRRCDHRIPTRQPVEDSVWATIFKNYRGNIYTYYRDKQNNLKIVPVVDETISVVLNVLFKVNRNFWVLLLIEIRHHVSRLSVVVTSGVLTVKERYRHWWLLNRPKEPKVGHIAGLFRRQNIQLEEERKKKGEEIKPEFENDSCIHFVTFQGSSKQVSKKVVYNVSRMIHGSWPTVYHSFWTTPGTGVPQITVHLSITVLFYSVLQYRGEHRN